MDLFYETFYKDKGAFCVGWLAREKHYICYLIITPRWYHCNNNDLIVVKVKVKSKKKKKKFNRGFYVAALHQKKFVKKKGE